MNRLPDDPGVPDEPSDQTDEGRANSVLGIILALATFALIAILVLQGFRQ